MITIIENMFHSNPDDKGFLPRTYENDCGIKLSSAKIIYCKDNTKWLAFWNEEEQLWQNANSSDKVYVNKESVIAYLDIPTLNDIKYLKEKST